MRSKVAERILAKTPEDVKIFTRLYGDLIVRINAILKHKGYTQKSLAEKLDKKPSEIHKWLSNEHNFTLRSLAKLQAELGETLLEVPKEVKHVTFQSSAGTTTFRVYKNNEPLKHKREKIDWQEISTKPQKQLANVG